MERFLAMLGMTIFFNYTTTPPFPFPAPSWYRIAQAGTLMPPYEETRTLFL
ncbi:MAG TPA: hypothetical protein PLC04_01705 [Candidatus Kapabacteria bacterium]|nr:hypothetical protein [Candidatus Kapabacteria bacterium]